MQQRIEDCQKSKKSPVKLKPKFQTRAKKAFYIWFCSSTYRLVFMSLFQPLDSILDQIPEVKRGFLDQLVGQTQSLAARHKRYNHCEIKHTKQCSEKKCIICLNSFLLSEYLHMLPCHHVFHPACISEWHKRKPECPVCKQIF